MILLVVSSLYCSCISYLDTMWSKHLFRNQLAVLTEAYIYIYIGGDLTVGRANFQWILLALEISSSLNASISEEAIETLSCSSTPILLD